MKTTLALNGLGQRKDYKVLLKNLQSATGWWITKYDRSRLQSGTSFDIQRAIKKITKCARGCKVLQGGLQSTVAIKKYNRIKKGDSTRSGSSTLLWITFISGMFLRKILKKSIFQDISSLLLLHCICKLWRLGKISRLKSFHSLS